MLGACILRKGPSVRPLITPREVSIVAFYALHGATKFCT